LQPLESLHIYRATNIVSKYMSAPSISYCTRSLFTKVFKIFTYYKAQCQFKVYFFKYSPFQNFQTFQNMLYVSMREINWWKSVEKYSRLRVFMIFLSEKPKNSVERQKICQVQIYFQVLFHAIRRNPWRNAQRMTQCQLNFWVNFGKKLCKYFLC
jgi:hypothetical protein